MSNKQLDKNAIEEFRKLYQQEYGMSLSDEKALRYGEKLVILVKSVYGDDLPEISDEN